MSELGPARHEVMDVSVGGLMVATAILGASLAIAILSASWTYRLLNTWEKDDKPPAFPLAASEGRRLPPEPRLEEVDRRETTAAQAHSEDSARAQDQRLKPYAWVDEKAGVVRIPIDQAMKILAKQSRLPARLDEPAGLGPGQSRRPPSSANSGRMAGSEPQ